MRSSNVASENVIFNLTTENAIFNLASENAFFHVTSENVFFYFREWECDFQLNDVRMRSST